MVLSLRDFSVTDRSVISSLMKLNQVELKNKRHDYKYNLENMFLKRSSLEVNRKINYLSNRIHLINWVINQKFKK